METRPKRNEQIHVRLSADLKEQLRRASLKDQRSIANMVVKILEEWSAEKTKELLKGDQK